MSDTNTSRLPLYIAATSLIVLLVLAGLSTFVYIQTQSELSDLRERMTELQSRIELIDGSGSNGIRDQKVYALTEKSVVQILNKQTGLDGLEPTASGSGFIYDKKGNIITNYHVIEEAETIEVTFLDGETVKAVLIGADPYSDLAVLKVETSQEKLKQVTLGNSSELSVGDTIYAVGAPFGLSWSLTKGVVSQIGRTLPTSGGYSVVGVIQVDAAINPGNSGGPLLNSLAEVVGVNTAIQSETGMFSGVGFAISSVLIQKVVPSLIEKGRYDHSWVGIAGSDVTPSIAEKMDLTESRGFLVISVVEDSPAERAGIRSGNKTEVVDGRNMTLGGDVITHIDNKTVRKLEDLLAYLEYQTEPGDKIILRTIRDGQILDIEVTLGVRPPPQTE
ncbi:trypsin [Candidatus Bathyarchaeota archaeon]|jgi:S1-C subfamily serine protease|nr:trypsin-like peptidase domain-containing protein [Candidatus Bathyarchaeota archaeon]RLI44718.1 MAG: trypsin [Candidatus Bathyarchaeota archaeon]